VFNFLMKIENISFFDAAKRLAQKLNIPLPEREKSPREILRNQEMSGLFQVNEMASDFFHSCLLNTNYGKVAKEYLTSRGISQDMIEKFHLGFAPPSWDKLLSSFRQRGVSDELLLKAGLVVSRASEDGFYDRFRDRIMFPIADARGRVVGFGGRVMDDNQQPKYLNSPETILFNKRHILYGLDLAFKVIKETRQVIVVEGYMDVISAHQQGIVNTVASLGTAFTPEQARQVLKCQAEIVFAYDSDAAGQNATLRALATVRDLGAAVRVVSIPDGKDPDEFLNKHGASPFAELINRAPNLVDYQLNRLLEDEDYSSFQGKVAVVEKIVPILADVTNAVEANMYITRLSQTLGVDEAALRSEVRKYAAQLKKKMITGVNKGNRSVLGLPGQMLSKTAEAERQLIRLMCDDPATVPYVQTQVSADEFKDALRQEIVTTIYHYFSAGQTVVPSMVADRLNESANNEFSHIMLMELEYPDVVRLLDDCVKAIHLGHLKTLFEQHRLMADELQRLGDSRYLQELAESKRINDEINRMRLV
ncbi:MAG TPA: DNA primase, partial [Negativicutes bacterium]|nr:DNA primase [Negativicutes bacterium]